MKSSVFLTDDLSTHDLATIERIALASDASFANLTQICDFDPLSDFRYADLRGMDFDGADLRGFDFTGADLRDVSGNCFIDASTILEGALLDGSVFSARDDSELGVEIDVYELLRRSHWTDQIIVLERELQRRDLPRSSKLATASVLYAMGKDSFIRRTAMRAMSKLMTVGEFLDFVRLQIQKGNHSPMEVLGAALHIVNEIYRTAPAECLKFLVELLGRDEALATNAAASIARNLRMKDISRMASYVKRTSGPIIRKSFIAAFAARLGPVHSMLVRDPISNETFDFDARLTDEQFNRVVRAVTRRVRSESNDPANVPRPFCETLGYPRNEKAVAKSVREMYRDLARAGGPSFLL